MAWEKEDLKTGERVAQAGVALVEQALFAEGKNFPNKVEGNIKLPDRNGNVQLNLPDVEFVNTMRQHDSDPPSVKTKVYQENIDTISDKNGKKLQTIDEQRQGFLIDINSTNRFEWCKTIVRNGEGVLQYQTQGTCNVTTQNGVFKDATFNVFDSQGKQLPVQIHIVGQATGPDSLKVSATTVYADKDGRPITDATSGKPLVLGTIEATISVDPENPQQGAKVKLSREGRTLSSLK